MIYSPRIDQHTRQLYRLGKLLGKPMTVVADDLLRHSLDNIEKVYGKEVATRCRHGVRLLGPAATALAGTIFPKTEIQIHHQYEL